MLERNGSDRLSVRLYVDALGWRHWEYTETKYSESIERPAYVDALERRCLEVPQLSQKPLSRHLRS